MSAPDFAIPHAPFAQGPADFAIGLSPIPEADWLEGGETDPAVRKDALLASNLADVWAETEGSRAGQSEALRLVEGAVGPIDPGAWPPLYAAARVVADDLCLMEKRGGAWRLTALSLSAGSYFTAAEAIGKSLAELHGPVPGFADRFLTRVERIFEGLRPGLILQRRNWTVSATGDLFAPSSAPVRASLPSIPLGDAAQRLFIRVERQTLRRLPATGGALFTIRIWRYRLAALAADPPRLAAFARAWRTAPPPFAGYKGFADYRPLVGAFLRAMGE